MNQDDMIRDVRYENARLNQEITRIEGELAAALRANRSLYDEIDRLKATFSLDAQELDRYRAAAEKLLRLRGKL